jgi:hypothetical protein
LLTQARKSLRAAQLHLPAETQSILLLRQALLALAIPFHIWLLRAAVAADLTAVRVEVRAVY